MGFVDQVRTLLGADPWAVHERRAGSWIAELSEAGAFARRYESPEEQRRLWEVADRRREEAMARWRAADPRTVGSTVLLMMRQATTGVLPTSWFWRDRWWDTLQFETTRSDAVLAARTAAALPAEWYESLWAVDIAVLMLERTGGAAGTDEEQASVANLLGWLDRLDIAAAPRPERVPLRARVLLLGPRGGAPSAASIHAVDSWSAVVMPALASSPDPDAAVAVVGLLESARGSRPGARWLEKAQRVVERPTARRLLEQMLTALADSPETPYGGRFRAGPVCVVAPENSDVARATAWAASQIDEHWVVPALAAVAARGLAPASMRAVDPNVDPFSGDKVLNAVILSLGLVGTADAIAALQRLSLATRHNGVRARISAALDAAADRSGLTRGQLVERMVSDEGFDAEGLRGVDAAPDQARLVLESPGAVRLQWAGADGWTSSAGADRDKAVVAIARRELKAARTAVAAERQRLEGLMGADRQWSYDEWRRYYRDHPVTGRLARALIWSFSNADGTGITGMPLAGDRVVGADNEARKSAQASTVRLWHPARASTDEVQAWRRWLMAAEVRQPFKQAFREIYVLTPAELETRLHSNRFAAHVVRYQQMYALTKERAWVANYLGPYDGGYDGAARHDLPDVGLTAVFQHYPVDVEAGAFGVDYATTDRVWFYRTGDRRREPVPLVDVPPLAFSEALRDVDLFVGVCSIALDPTWGLRQDDGHYAYWNQAAFGELTAAGDVRRDVLLRLVPKLKVSDRIEVLDRYVRVRGNLATYRIHLGSANILIEPDDRYLCILPSSKGKAPRLMLPFDGDEILSVILSKIVLLAADDKITDETIVHQIRRR